MPELPSFYDVLGIPNDATLEEIRRSYRELSRKSHPDLNPQAGSATKFIGVQAAYETLSDSRLRVEYDRKLVEDSNDPIQISVQFSRSSLPPFNEPQLLYALVKYQATPKFTAHSNPGLNLCLVLDRSTSMSGARLDKVKTAATELIRHTRRDDVLSAVSFSDRAEVLFPAEQNFDRHSAETQVRNIHGGGATEIFQGLEAGFQQIRRFLHKALINHIILITDGHTYGDEPACLNLADLAASQGVQITALGIGTEWNDEFLDELTSRTGGSTHFISKTSDLQKLMQEKFADLNQIFAEKVELEAEYHPGVELASIFRLQPDAGSVSSKGKLLLGNILNTKDLAVIFELIIHPAKEQEFRRKLLEGAVSMILPFDRGTIFSTPFRLSRLVAPVDPQETPPVEIMKALSHISLYRMQARARQEAAEGKYEAASIRLKILAAHLYSLGETDLAHTTLIEADRIQHTNLLSAEGQKQIKYATRALLLPALAKRIGAG